MGSYGELAALKSRQMTEVVRRFPRPDHIGRTLFPDKVVSVGTAGWDVVEGARNLARYISPGAEAHISTLLPRERHTAEIPFIKEKKTIDEETKNFIDRPGEYDEPYGDQAITDELEALDRMVENRRELSRWKALVDGELNVKDTETGVQFKVDYSVAATHKISLTGTDKWNDTTNSKPLKNLLTWKRLIAKDSGVTPFDAYLNSAQMENLVENSNIRDLLKYTVGDQLAKNGYITSLGGFTLQVYDVTYKDEAGTVRYYIPDDKVIIVAREGLGKAFVGPSDVPNDDGSGTQKVVGKFSYSYVTKDPVDTWLLVGIKEIPIIQNPNQLIIASVQ